MAVLDSVPGLAVSVLVDGNALQEYPDDEEAARLASLPEGIKTVPVFVEAVSEKEFVVRLSVDESFRLSSPVLIFDVIVDGNVAYRPIISSLYVAGSGLYKAMTKCSRHIEGVYFAIPGDLLRESLKKFKFSNIGRFTNL